MDQKLEQQIENLEVRMKAIEIRQNANESLVTNAIIADRRRTAKEKGKAREKLLAGLPYTKVQIAEMHPRNSRLLGGALGVKVFGLKKDVMVDLIFKAQKPTNTKRTAKKS